MLSYLPILTENCTISLKTSEALNLMISFYLHAAFAEPMLPNLPPSPIEKSTESDII